MEIQIGETFDAGNGVTLEVKKQGSTATKKCSSCYYRCDDGMWSDDIVFYADKDNVGGECAGYFRKDKTNVIFKTKDHGRKTEKN